jgi:GTPase Era involved in 16S rRNA processing
MKDIALNRRIEYLMDTVKRAKEVRMPKEVEVETCEKTIAYLKSMYHEIEKLKGLNEETRFPTVGVFGCPSRGKSTLVNALLGVTILPMNSELGTTRFGTELRWTDSTKFKITAYYHSKQPQLSEYKTEEGVRQKLENLSQKANVNNPDISRIEVEGPFRSFIGREFVFLDTPGVELGASKKELGDIIEHDFEADAQRALAVLSSADIVIFCMIAKYKERKDAEFYNQYIEEYNPLNVINAGDARDDDQTDEDIKKILRKDYGLIGEDTVIISGKPPAKPV